MAALEAGQKARPIKERFDAAVAVIRSLPAEGTPPGGFQPSAAVKLRFYALYKQAERGPCNIAKPAFWDVVGKAKWEAWKVCGNMSKEIAMQLYVEELQQLVETMPQTKEVQDFLRAIGPFYEIVDEEEEVEEEEEGKEGEEGEGEEGVRTGEKSAQATLKNGVRGEEVEEEGEKEEMEEEGEASESGSEDFQESFQELPLQQNSPQSTNSSATSPSSLTLATPITESGRHSEQRHRLSPINELPSPPSFYSVVEETETGTSSSRTGQRGRTGLTSPVRMSIIGEHGQLQPPYYVREGGSSKPPDGSRKAASSTTSLAQKDGVRRRGERRGAAESREGPLGSANSLPLAVEAVTSQLHQLQHSIQSLLQQVNTLAEAVHSLGQLYQQPASSQEDTTPTRHVQPAAQRRRSVLQLCLRLVPFIVGWPVAVNIIMSYLTRRFGGRRYFPSWIWSVLTFLHILTTLFFSFPTVRYLYSH